MHKYIQMLSEEQIKELCSIYAPGFQEIEIDNQETTIDIAVLDASGYQENYRFTDFNVKIVDWMGPKEFEYLKDYRKKMLGWFGNDYALDFLFYKI